MLLNWTLIFLVIALVAAALGFSGIAQESAWIAKVLFLIFIIIFLISILFNNSTPNI